MRIIALDPGGTTGWARLDWVLGGPSEGEPGPTWERGQIGPGDHHSHLFNFLYKEIPQALVVERFNYQRRKLDKGVSLVLDSREYIGVAKLYVQRNGVPPYPTACKLVMHQPAQKDFWSDDFLKRLGLWIPNRPHAMDATRHLLYYVTFTLQDEYYLQKIRTAAGS